MKMRLSSRLMGLPRRRKSAQKKREKVTLLPPDDAGVKWEGNDDPGEGEKQRQSSDPKAAAADDAVDMDMIENQGDDDYDGDENVISDEDENDDGDQNVVLVENDDIVSIEFPPDHESVVEVTTIGDIDPSELEQRIINESGMKVRVIVDSTTCDEKDNANAKREYTIEDLDGFCQSFPKLPSCTKGKWGRIYSSTVGAIVRIVVRGNDEDIFGTGFVIDKKMGIVMTCAHIFTNLATPLKVVIINCAFEEFEAQILHLSSDLDMCLLRVKISLTDQMSELQFRRAELNFGETVFCISNPHYEMKISNHPSFDPRLHFLGFLFSRGHTGHPFPFGLGATFKLGNYFHFHMNGLTNGSSGAPVMDRHGRVIGIYLSSSSDQNGSVVNNFALRQDSLEEGVKMWIGSGDVLSQMSIKRRIRKYLKMQVTGCWKRSKTKDKSRAKKRRLCSI